MAHEKKGNPAIGVGLKPVTKKEKKKRLKAFQKGFKETTSGFGLRKKK